ncbi:MAG: hypothetical protein HQL39_05955, partial [Alphaproteobacteria bacterium]|nr:hypothetical protein [Alphaproteobacteria bacterium]
DHVLETLSRHLPESVFALLPLLAVSRMFNLDILGNLVQAFSVSVSYQEQKKLLEISFVEQCLSFPPFYKLHDLLIAPLLRRAEHDDARRCLNILLAYAQRAILGGQLEVAQTVFAAVVNAIHATNLEDTELNERAIDLA